MYGYGKALANASPANDNNTCKGKYASYLTAITSKSSCYRSNDVSPASESTGNLFLASLNTKEKC